MILYSIPELKGLSKKIYKQLKSTRKLSQGNSKFAQYINGEWHTSINENIKKQTCLVIGSITPPENQLLKTLILTHTLKKEGAKKVILILPYFAYTRHDKVEPRQSLITDLVYKLLETSGVDEIITIDIHSKASKSIAKIPVTNIFSAKLFLNQITKADLKDVTIIAPDEGAIERANIFRQAAGVLRPITYFKKIRDKEKIKHIELFGKISDNVIIVDDILDTGFTLISCAKQLKKLGVKKITIVVTHGLFMEEKWQKLFKLNVTKIITTDSVQSVLNIKNKKIKIISCAPLLAEMIKSDIL